MTAAKRLVRCLDCDWTTRSRHPHRAATKHENEQPRHATWIDNTPPTPPAAPEQPQPSLFDQDATP